MIHNYERLIERYIKRLDSLCKENKNLILKFKRNCIANDLSLARISKLLEQLVIISEVKPKPFSKWEREDVELIIEWIDDRLRKEGLSLWTKREYKKTLKKFFNWLGKKELVDWFTVGEIKTRKFPDELLTEDDIRRLLDACKNSRDRALISVLWESGCRVGELGDMRIRDLNLQMMELGLSYLVRQVKELFYFRFLHYIFQNGLKIILIHLSIIGYG